MASEAQVEVVLVYSPAPREVFEQTLHLPSPCSALEALELSGLPEKFPAIDLGSPSLGIWGHRCQPETLLREGDRLEIYRALTVDPKVARRERFSRQGARSAGLFAKKRPGAKAGY